MPVPNSLGSIRTLVVVLGDQLDRESNALAGFDPRLDAIWMAEVPAEARHVWSHKQRIAVFLSAMRHFADHQRQLGRHVIYTRITEAPKDATLASELRCALSGRRPERVRMVEAGEHRVGEALAAVCKEAGVPLEVLEDGHFLASRKRFAAHAKGRKQLRMEFFYRELRKETGVLMEGDQPVGGTWNYDAENRESFGKEGPGLLIPPPEFKPDAITREVLEEVARLFPDHPGDLETFRWPVTPADAQVALESFIQDRLPDFGRHQDAMWTGEPWLNHSLLSVALNLKLIHPRVAIDAAEAAYRRGAAPLAAVEGFIRQILGWREYVRGVYWHFMPDYLERNALGATQSLPEFFWTGKTDMRCLREVIGQTLRYGYAHHIQRLMVTGLYSLLLGVKPQEVHAWYLAVYVDAIEWVELPNTLGMSQYGDGGVMASKPYVATGKYIQRMSNYCNGCRFDPSKSIGPDACPFTTLYWDFLMRHEKLLRANQRMALQVKNLARLKPGEAEAIRARAAEIRGICN